MRHEVRLSPGVVIESIGDDCLVMLPGKSTVVTLSGDECKQALAIREGEEVSLNNPAVQTLVRLGVVSAAPHLTRRHLITAGALGAGVGVTLLAMPTAAMASSRDILVELSDSSYQGGNDDGRFVELDVYMGDGFVRPVPEPVFLSGKIGSSDIPTSDIVVDDFSPSRRELTVRMFFSDNSSAPNLAIGTPLEVRFLWGEVTYRTTGVVAAPST